MRQACREQMYLRARDDGMFILMQQWRLMKLSASIIIYADSTCLCRYIVQDQMPSLHFAPSFKTYFAAVHDAC